MFRRTKTSNASRRPKAPIGPAYFEDIATIRGCLQTDDFLGLLDWVTQIPTSARELALASLCHTLIASVDDDWGALAVDLNESEHAIRTIVGARIIEMERAGK